MNDLPLLLVFGRPGRREHPTPSARYQFCSCSPPRFLDGLYAPRFIAEITLRDPNDPLRLRSPVNCYFAENDIGPQFDLPEDAGTVIPIPLEDVV
jgi:hypothetical protein